MNEYNDGDVGGGRKEPVKITGARLYVRGSRAGYVSYVFVFLLSFILDQAQVTLQLSVRAKHTRCFLLINTELV
jgi:hypothetical protein